MVVAVGGVRAIAGAVIRSEISVTGIAAGTDGCGGDGGVGYGGESDVGGRYQRGGMATALTAGIS